MNHNRNLSPHTAAMIPIDAMNMTAASNGMPPHKTRPPARTTPNMALSSMVTTLTVSSNDPQLVLALLSPPGLRLEMRSASEEQNGGYDDCRE